MATILRFVLFLIPTLPTAEATNLKIGNIDEDIAISSGIDGEHFEYIKVQRGSRTLMQYRPPSSIQRLVQSGLVAPDNESGPYLLTVWTRGPHSHTLLVFDLSLLGAYDMYDSIVHSYTSAWDVILKPTIDGLEIVGKGYALEDEGSTADAPIEREHCTWEKKTGTRNLDCQRQ